MQRTNPHKVLGLHSNAPRELVEEAYWLLTNNATSRQRILDLNLAYEIIASGAPHAATNAPAAGERASPRQEDYYELLRVDGVADTLIIDLAFEAMRRRLNGDDRRQREELSRARDVLRDRGLRAEYDRWLRLHPGQPFAALGAFTASDEPGSAAASETVSQASEHKPPPEHEIESLAERLDAVRERSSELLRRAAALLGESMTSQAKAPRRTVPLANEQGAQAPNHTKTGANRKKRVHSEADEEPLHEVVNTTVHVAPASEQRTAIARDDPAGNWWAPTTPARSFGNGRMPPTKAAPAGGAATSPGAVEAARNGSMPLTLVETSANGQAATSGRTRTRPSAGSQVTRTGRVPAKRRPRPGGQPESPAAKPVVRVIDDPDELLLNADVEAALGFDRGDLARHQILPLTSHQGVIRIAVTSPKGEDIARGLAGRLSQSAQIVYATPRAIRGAMVKHFFSIDQYLAAFEHADRHPQLSARRVISRAQAATGLALAALLIGAFATAPLTTAIALVSVATMIYTVSLGYKVVLIVCALAHPCEIPTPPEEVARLSDDELPVYSILLPVYREGLLLNDLVEAIDRIDYPKDKLDVKLLLEPDDVETQAVAAQIVFPPHFHVLVVPPDGPKSKPKACNYGLLHARGDFIVLYDAEDRPDPQQLKKALVAFARGGFRVSCVQAKLSYFNPNQNLLTRWFTIEYATWFDLYLPGLTGLGAPITLGGTSNHFRTDLLRRVGAWDPFNVTEDADLGIRFARYNLITSVIDSVTLEEANSRLGNWMRQRSRWVKGYMQTWLVHMRQPVRLWRDLGPMGFLSFQAFVLGTFFAYFVNPVFWVLVLGWYVTHANAIHAVYPSPILYLSLVALFGGNFLFLLAAMAGCLRRGFFEGVKYALLSPIYWLLMSIAAWKALHQLIFNTHYWEKTDHGLVSEPHGQSLASSR